MAMTMDILLLLWILFQRYSLGSRVLVYLVGSCLLTLSDLGRNGLFRMDLAPT
jgi:hypothetical protein